MDAALKEMLDTAALLRYAIELTERELAEAKANLAELEATIASKQELQ